MLKQGDKFKTKLGMTEGEVIGTYPQGQTASSVFNDGAYQVLIGGYKGTISKQLFETLFDEGVIPVADVFHEVKPKKKVVKHNG